MRLAIGMAMKMVATIRDHNYNRSHPSRSNGILDRDYQKLKRDQQNATQIAVVADVEPFISSLRVNLLSFLL